MIPMIILIKYIFYLKAFLKCFYYNKYILYIVYNSYNSYYIYHIFYRKINSSINIKYKFNLENI